LIATARTHATAPVETDTDAVRTASIRDKSTKTRLEGKGIAGTR